MRAHPVLSVSSEYSDARLHILLSFARGAAPANSADVPWLASLERVGSPSAPPAPSPSSSPIRAAQQPVPSHSAQSPLPAPSSPYSPAASRPPAEDETDSLRAVIQTQQQTISLLVSEKASLGASVERLSEVESSECRFSERRLCAAASASLTATDLIPASDRAARGGAGPTA